MKNLNARERYRRKYLSMYKSMENRMQGENIIWWNSLSMKARYSLVFRWRDTSLVKFKHFLKSYKSGYRINLTNRRNAVIEQLLK